MQTLMLIPMIILFYGGYYYGMLEGRQLEMECGKTTEVLKTIYDVNGKDFAFIKTMDGNISINVYEYQQSDGIKHGNPVEVGCIHMKEKI